ncbi:MAG: phosphoribosylanthranilate isomerase [Truepera sp.]|nr:phosphoribosylanthranilate isomerase [Truepera sp.]
MRVKICGITRPEDAELAESAGADAIGLVFAPNSKRLITLERAAAIAERVGPLITRVGVFVDAPLEQVLAAVHHLRLGAVQLHGSEDSVYAAAVRKETRVIRAVSFRPGLPLEGLAHFPADALLVDGLRPGSGETFDWSQASSLTGGAPHLILAGGLAPENVAAGIRALRPYAVDVASGVEASPGIKDPEKVAAFVRNARAALDSEASSRPRPFLRARTDV